MIFDDTFGWYKLRCSFFTSVCRRVLNDYFNRHGFVERDVGPIGEILYKKLDLFIEVGYVPESSPNYSLTIILGTDKAKLNKTDLSNGVPFWYLLPNGFFGEKPERFEFESETDLNALLSRTKNDVLENYMKPLWNDRALLKKTIIKFQGDMK